MIEKLEREVYHHLQAHRYDRHYDHPLNQIISSLISSGKNEELFLLVLASNDTPARLSYILLAMRFASVEHLTDSHYFLLKLLLERESLIVRTSAVELLEHWGTESALALLRSHQAREKVKWLGDYILKVLNPTPHS